MARRSGEKSRNERLNSGPSTKLVSRGGRGNQNKKSGFNRSSGSRNKYGSGSNLKAPRNRRQMIIMAIVLIAFIFGILIGLSFIFDNHDTNQDDSPEFENVTGNISKYNAITIHS